MPPRQTVFRSPMTAMGKFRKPDPAADRLQCGRGFSVGQKVCSPVRMNASGSLVKVVDRKMNLPEVTDTPRVRTLGDRRIFVERTLVSQMVRAPEDPFGRGNPGEWLQAGDSRPRHRLEVR